MNPCPPIVNARGATVDAESAVDVAAAVLATAMMYDRKIALVEAAADTYASPTRTPVMYRVLPGRVLLPAGFRYANTG